MLPTLALLRIPTARLAAAAIALLPAARALADANGAAYVWGDGRDGAVGNNSTANSGVPVAAGA